MDIHRWVWTDLAAQVGCVDKLGRPRMASDAGKNAGTPNLLHTT